MAPRVFILAGTFLRFFNFRKRTGDRPIWRLFLRTPWYFPRKKSQRGGNHGAIQTHGLAWRRGGPGWAFRLALATRRADAACYGRTPNFLSGTHFPVRSRFG